MGTGWIYPSKRGRYNGGLGDVAQLGERRVRNAKVGSSILLVSTTLSAAPPAVARRAVSRAWRAFGLQPHRVETFKLSTDPLFIDKVRDIVGLYLNPPTKAMVLCVDAIPARVRDVS